MYVFLLRNKKTHHRINVKTPSYLELWIMAVCMYGIDQSCLKIYIKTELLMGEILKDNS